MLWVERPHTFARTFPKEESLAQLIPGEQLITYAVEEGLQYSLLLGAVRLRAMDEVINNTRQPT